MRQVAPISKLLRAYTTSINGPNPTTNSSQEPLLAAQAPASQPDLKQQLEATNKVPTLLTMDQRRKISQHLDSLLPKYDDIGKPPPQLRQRQNLHSDSINHIEYDELKIADLLAANVHLGHSEKLWNRVNLQTTFGTRNGINIINLEHTLTAMRRSAKFVRQVAYYGGMILFVGTSPLSRKIAIDSAYNCEQYYVVDKWCPGTLTNISHRLDKSSYYIKHVLDVPEASNLIDAAKKQAELKAKTATNSRFGFRNNNSRRESRYNSFEKKSAEASNSKASQLYMPDVIIALNPLSLKNMLAEAVRTYIPTIGIIDTNFDPRNVTYSIPGNDDSVTSVNIIASYLSSAALAGKIARKNKLLELSSKQPTDTVNFDTV
ncbi:hypothetical protein BB561_001410 [Smittium simulii]|uniref:Ribosomal protein S2 n=1 Tax=Smittium simulii TaxID=133385 RepID=A0A2T9YUV9_9FUNG|nr:hypothetical protein BB561_001410 [Smittium simulii]